MWDNIKWVGDKLYNIGEHIDHYKVEYSIAAAILVLLSGAILTTYLDCQKKIAQESLEEANIQERVTEAVRKAKHEEWGRMVKAGVGKWETDDNGNVTFILIEE